MSNKFDLVIVGSGPAGYVGAIYAAQNGMKVAVIEKNKTLGGTCLNIGCIPTKALLFSALHFSKAQKLSEYGIKLPEGEITLDFAQVNKRKNDIVHQITNGVAFLMKKNKIEVISGWGKVRSSKEVDVVKEDGAVVTLKTEKILLATGSRVKSLPHIHIDGKNILSSDHILNMDKVPDSLAVIGGGVIGCEFASCYSRFGSKVEIFEIASQILPTEDKDVAKELTRSFKKQKIKVHNKVKVEEVKSLEDSVSLKIEGKDEPVIFKKALVSVGRAPNTEDIGLENVNIETTRGFIPVDLKTYETSASGVYAVGDIIPTAQLAHTASAEAIAAIDAMIGKNRAPINYESNPGVVYTYPEVASVGQNEEQLKDKGIEYTVGKFPFMPLGKSKVDDATEGFVKILVGKEHGEILGVHMVGGKVSEHIHSMSLGMNLEMTIEDIAHTIFPHPTLSEAIMEAAHHATGHAIHM